MAYRVIYTAARQRSVLPGRSRCRVRTLTAIFLLLFLMAVRCFWPGGTAALQEFLLPGQPSGTATAYYQMIDSIRQGEPLQECVTAFCVDVIQSANGNGS